MRRVFRSTKSLFVGLVPPVAVRTMGYIKTRRNLLRYRDIRMRKLEIGPGNERLPGFETLDIVGGRQVDYVLNAAEPLPFADGTYSLVYASHVLEHIPWYQVHLALREWVRILSVGGQLELVVPDALKICEVIVEYERLGVDSTSRDGWYRFNDERDPCKWAAGRVFSYGDGSGTAGHPNWHRALFTPRYLAKVMECSGLTNVHRLGPGEVRGYDHGWISLGMRGSKP